MFDRNIKEKKRTNHKTQKEKVTQNPPSLGLFTFVVWLAIDGSVVVIIIFLFCPRRWLFSYVLPCLQNLKTKLITNSIGTSTRLTTNKLLTKIGIKHGSWNPSLLFLECPHYNFFFVVLLCLTLALSTKARILCLDSL